jgi:23S rRNA (guanine2535-N1)-methyltransferase
MTYRFAINDESYEDFAAGRVLRSAPGHTAFPVRLAREIFEQCRALQDPSDAARGCLLYDPCCGSAILLTVLGFSYPDHVAAIAASDVSEDALALARDNLSLLAPLGMDSRVADLEALSSAYGKPSHAAAIASARLLRARQASAAPAVTTFVADARDATAVRRGLGDLRPDVVIADVPYGRTSAWRNSAGDTPGAAESLDALLQTLLAVTSPKAIIALATDRDQKVARVGLERRRQLRIGKRRVTWLSRGDAVG